MTDSAQQIKFGTDGWRGFIADDFTYDNVALVGSAIRRYLLETGVGGKPLLVGYDRRFSAEFYAAHLATHLRAEGQPVQVFDAACPTPVVAFAVRNLDAAGAVMLTASHNPYYYQGLKFIPYFAGPAMPETTDRITELVREIAPSFTPPPVQLKWDGELVNQRKEYFAKLDSFVSRKTLGAGNLRILYSAMHGCGAGYLDEYLRLAGVEVESVATERDVYFGGSLPDPSAANLAPLAQRAAEAGYTLACATDGDADRFGIVDPQGRYFSASQALPMLADYLIQAKGLRGALVRTLATSHLLDAVAQAHGLPLVETLVGFKYLGDELRRGALIGGEESGGISIQGHVPEKDGILATLLILEMVADTDTTLAELYDQTQERFGRRDYKRIDFHLDDVAKQTLLARLRDWSEPQFAGRQVGQHITLDGIKFVFSDGSWAMVRASGTEPVVRVYMEAVAPESLDRIEADVLAELGAGAIPAGSTPH